MLRSGGGLTSELSAAMKLWLGPTSRWERDRFKAMCSLRTVICKAFPLVKCQCKNVNRIALFFVST